MSRICRLRSPAMFVTALALFTLALALSPAGAARAATTTVIWILALAATLPRSRRAADPAASGTGG